MQDQPMTPDRPGPGPNDSAPPSGGSRRVRSEELLKGGVELLIEHQGREYRLRVTQNGKLILTA
jgi:hemin uptake protein HemP